MLVYLLSYLCLSFLAIVLHFILCCYSIEKELNYSNLLTVYLSLNASPLVGGPPPPYDSILLFSNMLWFPEHL